MCFLIGLSDYLEWIKKRPRYSILFRSILTGRNHFRDCVDYVFGCSDMTECVPDFEFAPSRTFTVGDAVRSAGKDYEDGAIFLGKVSFRNEEIRSRVST